jgi:hypothetical protein
MKKLTFSLFLSLMLSGLFYGSMAAGGASLYQERISYNSYSNARFLYSIDYPAGILIPQREADNSDGRQFLSRDGHAKMLVYGRYALDTDSLQKEFDEAVRGEGGPNRAVTLKRIQNNWFVVSGTEDGKIFYRKTFFTGGAFKTFRIEYDEEVRKLYDKITAHMAKSFRA